MRYLTARQLLLIHSLVIDETGGAVGVRDKGRLESVEQAPQQILFGVEQYPTAFDKAAVYIHNIIHDHPFVDGNKRTAMLAGLTFLEQNDYKCDNFKPTEIEDVAVKIATHEFAIPNIADWLEQRCVAVKT